MKSKICTHLRIAATAFIAVLCGITNAAQAQCPPASSFNFIDANNVRARLNNGGDMFYSPGMGSEFTVPKVRNQGDVKRSTIYSGALWLGAYSNASLKTAAMTYRQSGSDFFAGPLDTLNAEISSNDCMQWDKIWHINRSTIDSFKAGLFTSVPTSISTWPAHGDATKGQAKNLAPFVDVDFDGIYDPSKGDYPAIQGDQMVWWVFNDKGNEHKETGGEPLGVEVHASAYSFDMSQDTPLYHTVFVEYKIFNRSKERLDSMYIGNFTDFDLGFPYDDYVGSDSVLNAFYVYNGDEDDEGARGYGANPPSQAVILLNRNLNKFMYYNNDFTVKGIPQNTEHYYYYLSGRWKDGQTLTYDGDGRIFTDIPANFMFPGNPTSTDINDWNEKMAGNIPGDRKGLGSTGPITMQPGQMEKFIYAYVYTRNTEGGSTGAINQMKRDLVSVKNFYDNNLVTGIKTPICPVNNINIYPNPANEQIYISVPGAIVNSIRIINTLGQEISAHRNLNGNNNVQVSTISLPAGIYTILIETSSGPAAKKLSINR